MYRDHSVAVVIPAYNEAGLIGPVIREVPAFVDRIYVIDDRSTDTTWAEILDAGNVDHGARPRRASVATDGGQALLERRTEIATARGRVVPIRHDRNRGAGGAIKTGYLAALGDGHDVTVTVDGDGQMDPAYMADLLDPIVDGRADYAKGNRLQYREYRSAMPRFRYVGNAVLTFLTKIASGYWKTMDPQNGYTAISQHALANVGIESLYEGYGYLNDLLVKLNAKGMRVADVAIPAKYGAERSSIAYPSYIWHVSGMLLRNFLWRLKVKYLVLDFHPLALFYVIGALTAGAGVFVGIWSVYGWWTLGLDLFVRAVLSLMVLTIGTMFLLFAMLFDMQVNEDKEVRVP